MVSNDRWRSMGELSRTTARVSWRSGYTTAMADIESGRPATPNPHDPAEDQKSVCERCGGPTIKWNSIDPDGMVWHDIDNGRDMRDRCPPNK